MAAPASSSGATAVAAKKCKKKHRHRKRCKKPAPSDPVGVVIPPSLTISPTSHNFGSLNHTSVNPTPSFIFTITNTGGFAMNISFHMTGANADQFLFDASSNTCIGRVPIGASCHLGIKFKPTTVGAKSATLNAVGLYDVTASAALSGTGT